MCRWQDEAGLPLDPWVQHQLRSERRLKPSTTATLKRPAASVEQDDEPGVKRGIYRAFVRHMHSTDLQAVGIAHREMQHMPDSELMQQLKKQGEATSRWRQCRIVPNNMGPSAKDVARHSSKNESQQRVNALKHTGKQIH